MTKHMKIGTTELYLSSRLYTYKYADHFLAPFYLFKLGEIITYSK